MENDQELRSLRRGLLVLGLVNQVEAVSIAHAAMALALPRTTAERILNALTADGYLERSALDKRYRLTSKVVTLASGFSGASWITHVAVPMLKQLTKEIGWPLAIASAEGPAMRVRYTTDTMTSLWLNRRRIGGSLPIPQASSGTVHLAFASEAERLNLQKLLEQTYPGTPVDTAQVAAARASGYAFSPKNTREQSISVPIFMDGKIEAVLLMMFMSRVHKRAAVVENYLPRLVDLARSIGERADHDAYPPEAPSFPVQGDPHHQ